VLTRMMGAEQELAAVEQFDTNIGLSAAAIATVGSGQVRSRGYCCVHVAHFPSLPVDSPGATRTGTSRFQTIPSVPP
jgi:hypothetical protein